MPRMPQQHSGTTNRQALCKLWECDTRTHGDEPANVAGDQPLADHYSCDGHDDRDWRNVRFRTAALGQGVNRGQPRIGGTLARRLWVGDQTLRVSRWDGHKGAFRHQGDWHINVACRHWNCIGGCSPGDMGWPVGVALTAVVALPGLAEFDERAKKAETDDERTGY